MLYIKSKEVKVYYAIILLFLKYVYIFGHSDGSYIYFIFVDGSGFIAPHTSEIF